MWGSARYRSGALCLVLIADRSTLHVVLDNRSPSHFPTATSFAVPSQLVVVISPCARTPINMKLSVKFTAVHYLPKEDGTPFNMFVRFVR
ncbi:hypothetical protein BDZ88DRAFT_227810 [Geranomyces variabilis]|nr:hypothetical protein BDZ88DRAFT_227810 [Geranomyces variabilis]